MNALKSIYCSIKLGMLTTFKCLNIHQIVLLMWKIITGKALEEIEITGGKRHLDKTFYIIRRDYTKVGLFSIYNTNAGHIKYALDKGYIPVIDMQHYRNCYLEDSELGKKNSWEFYFKQPCDYSLAEAYQGKNIILSNILPTSERPNDDMDYFNDINDCLSNWKKLVANYITIDEEIIKEANDAYKSYTLGGKCIGVSVRGTDYITLKPPEHPIQPPVELVIKDVQKIVSDQKYEKIYLCTEDKHIIDEFNKHFGDTCFVYSRNIFDYSTGSIIEKKLEANINRYNDGKKYLIAMLMLTMTDSLIASRTSGSVAVEIMAPNHWEHQLIYNIGRYPKKGE